ncbi:MAG TPA: tetratricopeptide repeat protein [Polyangiaceae bacterium]|nr:tetratricopeptide repeat protein [Polyangiaceae bacterium]
MRRRSLYWLAPLALVAGALGLALGASGGPHDPFERYSPEVDAAVASLEAGRFDEANERLTRYLRLTGCHEGVLQTPPGATASADAAFDLGLGLFGAAEKLGQRFADVDDVRPQGPDGKPAESNPDRRSSVDCARMLLGALLERRLPPELEARARFLRGNAAFLEHRWDEALADYDRALRLAPGSDAPQADALGRDLAWNRSLAMRNRQREKEREEKERKENDQPSQGGQGGAPNEKGGQGGAQGQDQKNDPQGQDDPKSDPQQNDGQGGQGGQGDQGQDDKSGQGGQGGGQGQPPPQGQGDPNDQQQASGAPRGPTNQDEHMLDQFEQAPTWQREEGKVRGAGRKLRGVADK